MTSPVQSTIAQVLYPNEQVVDFARIVADLETVLTRLRGDVVEVHWDCEGLVTFDLPDTRVLLATTEFGRAGQGTCLTLAVGPSGGPDPWPGAVIGFGSVDHAVFCSRLVERIQGRFAPAAILWQQVDALINADLVDTLAEGLPQLGAALAPVKSSVDKALPQDSLQIQPAPVGISAAEHSAPKPSAVAQPVAAMPAPGSESKALAANDTPDLPRPKDEVLANLRLALYPVEDASDSKPSTQIRLAAHCLNATLILVYAPLGAAVMTYSLLKGEDIRFSGRMMALVGTVVGLSQTPLGHTVKAMASTMASTQGWH
jgi:hypothetical protein